MTQPALAPIIPSPLCSYTKSPCWRGGRCVVGPVEHLDGCDNYPLTCQKCGATGVRSTNLRVKANG